MTHEHAFLIVYRLWFMFAMCGLILFASNAASTKQAERIRKTKKKTAGKRSNVRAKKTLIDEGLKAARRTKTKRPLSKKYKAPVLSESDQRRYTDYIIRRDGGRVTSNMPL